MVGITAYPPLPSSLSAASATNTTSPSSALSAEHNTDASLLAGSTGSINTVSSLARQLNDAATRAETRLDRASPVSMESIKGNGYFTNRAQHDAEVPDTDDPQLRARARQATGFLNGSDSNPFKGLAHDQLSLIAHDDGGTFTINERRAAWEELKATAVPGPTHTVSATGMGRELMNARLFAGVEPGVANGAEGMSVANIGRLPFEFLTHDDRNLLSQMYVYAQEQGADLAYVDSLARELGNYRQHDDGRLRGNFNNGHHYDAEGRQLTVNFNDRDAATASRLLSSAAINSTLVDRGFLYHILDPGFGALSNTSNLEFLEQMVTKFSNEAATQTPLDSQFDTYVPVINLSDNIVMTRSPDIKIHRDDPLVINNNGVWSITEKGKAAGYTLVNGIAQRPPASVAGSTPADSTAQRDIWEALASTSDQPAERTNTLSGLFKLLWDSGRPWKARKE
ncbi:hypothetical protein [Pseudomonas sp. MWU15-20650]|uniref:hypothetical protein n=1 Tax=Pseudomonas sp. MWU15-20650 TaxID=2933107 RepID=UPI00200BAAB0|nr:hypothetical protein [Pseudomonas sp. MWU15-20650]